MRNRSVPWVKIPGEYRPRFQFLAPWYRIQEQDGLGSTPGRVFKSAPPPKCSAQTDGELTVALMAKNQSPVLTVLVSGN